MVFIYQSLVERTFEVADNNNRDYNKRLSLYLIIASSEKRKVWVGLAESRRCHRVQILRFQISKIERSNSVRVLEGLGPDHRVEEFDVRFVRVCWKWGRSPKRVRGCWEWYLSGNSNNSCNSKGTPKNHLTILAEGIKDFKTASYMHLNQKRGN